MSFTFSVAGTPRPQPRPRFVKGRAVSTVSSKVKLWREGVRRVVKAGIEAHGVALPGFTGPVRVTMIFSFKPPANAMERIGTPHTHRPDAENLSKLILDVMTECRVYRDDSQVAAAPPEKWWAAQPGVAVLVESMEGERREDPVLAFRNAPDWLSGQ